ncbi:hypothetical protein [Microbacterium luticocti]|uniref:hypothetical protein n=1 Tax=Microbacterium luticocti TaxID=451764 RepID=UPI0012EB618B|nr:hypothetical protein [Microbacterium luticocti]
MPSEFHESPVITQSEDRTDDAVVWLTWGSVALIACSLAVLITAPFELWALLALVFAAAAAVVALFARRRAIRLRRKGGLMIRRQAFKEGAATGRTLKGEQGHVG